MEKTFEVFRDVSWHINVYILLVVIPFNGQTTLVIPFKVYGDFAISYKSVQEMISIDIRKLFNTKIFNKKEKNVFFIACG